MTSDFGIFNEATTESTAKFSQTYNVELKTYKEHIKELYDILCA